MSVPLSAPLADAIFWIAVAGCALAELLIIRSAFRTPLAPVDARVSVPLRRGVEVVWAILPALVLVLVLVLTRRAMHRHAEQSAPAAAPVLPAGVPAAPLS